ncbi:prepilin-type N-terminal cleavage/methylation domain-containing protein [Deinococcus sp. KSM4-11]|uniref:prepilin-type N-terminal cleavage/methylation domain-containing protein n=1 Tax=Deinococcus sp. KSM4-11 TaxID=2568654 RepID=UPI001454C307|nr:prepilin-type N-terminal cleavage/methylation domain-containing protein [Deinococcus sp. KSM4-11]
MKSQSGLTLVEILVAMAILGIILILVTNWETQTLQLTTKTNTLATQIAELNDLSGYIGDRVRSASQVRLTGFTVNAASAVNAGKCDTTTPCLAVLALEEEVNTATTPSTVTRTWFRLVYRVEPRSTWSSVSKVPDTWADNAANNVVVVREYRDNCIEASGGVCSASSPPLTVDAYKASFSDAAFSSMSPALVTDYLSSVDQSGAAITPFALDTVTNTIILTFQSKRNVKSVTTFTPADNPMTLAVQARNVN